MAAPTDTFDLAALRLTSGEGRRMDLHVSVDSFELGGEPYAVTAADGAPLVPVKLDISRMTGQGYALHVSFSAALHGPCMRCLEPVPAEGIRFDIDAREVNQPDLEPLEDLDEPEPRQVREELESPYVSREAVLDLSSWVHDALALAMPVTLLCRPDCRGLCPVCGENLNSAGPEHHHEQAPDPRWAALSDLKIDGNGSA